MLVMKGGLVKPRLCADLTKLAEFNSGLNGLRNMHTVRLVNIPALVKASNPYAFAELKEFTVENASLLEKNPAIVEKRKQDALRKQNEEEERKRRREEEKRREEEERKKRQEKGIVLEPDDYHRVPLHVKTLLISGCGDFSNAILDLSRFSVLEELQIGYGCFNKVSKMSVVGLTKLKSVAIGAKSFQNESNDSELVVSDCPELASLTIGNDSFRNFKGFKLSSLPSLATLVVGAHCFTTVSFVVKDLNSLTSICLGEGCFEKSRHTVVESSSWSLE